jgi:hypothetical protein
MSLSVCPNLRKPLNANIELILKKLLTTNDLAYLSQSSVAKKKSFMKLTPAQEPRLALEESIPLAD